jgi:hypothetical protein
VRFSGTRCRRLVVASFVFVTIAGWQVEAAAGQLSLTWIDNSSDEAGFSVERSTGASGTFAQIVTTGPGVTAYTDSGLADATTYCYRVRAFNNAGYSGYGNTACTTTSQAFGLAVLRIGVGSGAVTSVPAGIACGATCSGSFPSGTAVTLSASAEADSTFSGWDGGACSGTGACAVTVTAATTVTAAFDVQSVRSAVLTVGRIGTGSGTVTSAPAGITCGATCSGSFPDGTPVTLTASPGIGSSFTGWSGGGCTGTGSCAITLSAATTVAATFGPRPVLRITKNGGGVVTSTPAGINCGGACSATYTSATTVTLTATPAARFSFTGWSGGGCTGTGTCRVTLSAATTVAAIFGPQPVLRITRAGSGVVTSTPAGINCGGKCSASYASGTTVTLTATAAAGFSFTGWSGGGCTGVGTCTVTLTALTAVNASFVRP